EIAEKVGAFARQDPRRGPVSSVAAEEYEIFGIGRVELVELEPSVKDRQVPVQQVDEDPFSGGEHGTHGRIPRRIPRRRLVDCHVLSSVCECRGSDHIFARSTYTKKWGWFGGFRLDHPRAS